MGIQDSILKISRFQIYKEKNYKSDHKGELALPVVVGLLPIRLNWSQISKFWTPHMFVMISKDDHDYLS